MYRTTSLDSARVELRMNADLKNEVEEAAALLGVSLTAFATESMVQRAREVKQQHSVTKLYGADCEAFANLIANPPKPNKALLKTMQTTVRPKRG